LPLRLLLFCSAFTFKFCSIFRSTTRYHRTLPHYGFVPVCYRSPLYHLFVPFSRYHLPYYLRSYITVSDVNTYRLYRFTTVSQFVRYYAPRCSTVLYRFRLRYRWYAVAITTCVYGLFHLRSPALHLHRYVALRYLLPLRITCNVSTTYGSHYWFYLPACYRSYPFARFTAPRFTCVLCRYCLPFTCALPRLLPFVRFCRDYRIAVHRDRSAACI